MFIWEDVVPELRRILETKMDSTIPGNQRLIDKTIESVKWWFSKNIMQDSFCVVLKMREVKGGSLRFTSESSRLMRVLRLTRDERTTVRKSARKQGGVVVIARYPSFHTGTWTVIDSLFKRHNDRHPYTSVGGNWSH